MEKDSALMSAWLRAAWASDGDQVLCIDLYTDGSAEVDDSKIVHKVSRAGWGAVVLAWCIGEDGVGRRKVLGTRFGQCRDEGKGFSAPAAEINAAAIVLQCLASSGHEEGDLVSAAWTSDSTYALDGTQAKAATAHGDRYARMAKTAWVRLSQWCKARAIHVYSHRGEVWNEAADVLAKQGCKHGKWVEPMPEQPAAYKFSLYSAIFGPRSSRSVASVSLRLYPTTMLLMMGCAARIMVEEPLVVLHGKSMVKRELVAKPLASSLSIASRCIPRTKRTTRRLRGGCSSRTSSMNRVLLSWASRKPGRGQPACVKMSISTCMHLLLREAKVAVNFGSTRPSATTMRRLWC